MFGKRKAAKSYNNWTLEYKRLWDTALVMSKRLRATVGTVETARCCVELYPNGALKDEAKTRLATTQEELINSVNNYNKAVDFIKSYYTAHHEDIEISWHPDQWQSAIEVIEYTYRQIHKLYFIEN